MLRGFRFATPIFFDDDGAAGPQTLDDGNAAMNARLDAAFGAEGGTPQGTPAPDNAGADNAGGQAPPAPAAPPEGDTGGDIDPFSDEAIEKLIPEGMAWRDGDGLRRDLAKFRDRYKPIHEMFGGLDDDTRSRVFEAAPGLGGDLARLIDASSWLHPQDRALVLEGLEMLSGDDPVGGAQRLAWFAQAVEASTKGEAPPAFPQQGQGQGQAPPPGAPEDLDDDDELDRPMTRREWETAQAEREQQIAWDRSVADHTASIRRELIDLGYDPEKAKSDPVEQGRIAAILDVAQRPEIGGDLSRAHEILDGVRQRYIDEYVAAKAADAGRPSSPANAGAAPNASERTVETMEDAFSAMESRLDGAFGPRR